MRSDRKCGTWDTRRNGEPEQTFVGCDCKRSAKEGSDLHESDEAEEIAYETTAYGDRQRGLGATDSRIGRMRNNAQHGRYEKCDFGGTNYEKMEDRTAVSVLIVRHQPRSSTRSYAAVTEWTID